MAKCSKCEDTGKCALFMIPEYCSCPTGQRLKREEAGESEPEPETDSRGCLYCMGGIMGGPTSCYNCAPTLPPPARQAIRPPPPNSSPASSRVKKRGRP